MKKISLLFLLLCGHLTYAQQQPNIIIIVSDDHAFQSIGAYGSKLMKTPSIDRIAKEGVRFDKGYVTNSICGPSRAVILTGKYSHKNGFKDNENSRFDGSQDSFIKQLKGGGYQTAWIGKWHLESTPQGFDHWQVLPDQGQYYNPDFLMQDGTKKRYDGYVTNVVEDVAEEWLDQRDQAKPFCLVIGHKATHRVWLPDTADMGMFDQVTFPLPHNFYDDYKTREAAKVQDMSIAKTMIMGYDLKMFGSEAAADREGSVKRMNAAQRAKFNAYYQPIEADLKARNLSGKALTEWKYQHYMRDYLSTAASLDRNIGRTLDYLDKKGLTKNTIVIYMSDQGFYLGEHGWFDKRFIYEESFRTPMVMRYPGVIKPGSVSKDFVMNLDIAPTMLDAAGIAIPKDIQGKSMLPQLRDKKTAGRKVMFYHYYENGEHSVSPHFGIRNSRYKLIRFYKRVNSWELFDLKKDPNELNNLYGKPGYEKITAEMKKELDAQIASYEDQDAAAILAQGIKPEK
ncbi:sulfatase family protein [Pedobacter gandavensis]|uniref:Sulfatase-like hydrolase/transferase n=1 Tax=Pedobacter gandavensis TaxID=2679963 RepID=A0ABR6EVF1_9SPHI|nr:sulfatase [Pedobacter gandavensis]MBB2149254.1 sulfatase-like hydrolase/transferase [Pedobacter gandavensis]